MTCIAGLVHGGGVYIGGDSAGVGGTSLTIRADKKVFCNGPFAIGFAGSFRMGNLLRYAFRPPQHPSYMDAHEFMVTMFVTAVRTCLSEGGVAQKEHEQEKVRGDFLVGYRGRLFQIGFDYQVGEALDGYDAVGTGEQAALGALYATRGQDPVQRIFVALRAAERVNAGVRAPFSVVSVATHAAMPADAPAPTDAWSDGAGAGDAEPRAGPRTPSKPAA